MSNSIASLTCLVFFEIGLPNVEWDKNATLGSNPNNRATRTQDLDTFTSLFGEGKSCTFVSATNTVFPFETIIVIPKISSPGLESTTFFNFSIEAA